MCGITGAIMIPRHRSEQEWAEIRMRAMELMVAIDERGRDGIGFASVNRDGSHRVMRARGTSWSNAFDPEWRAILGGIGPDTTLLIGHTRFGTSGTLKDINEYHPFVIGNIIGCHNGWVANDCALARTHDIDVVSACDSEIIFHLMNRMAGAKALNTRVVQNALEQIMGSYAVAAADLRAPDRIILAAGTNPLAIQWKPHLDILWFASTREALYHVDCLADRIYGRLTDEMTTALPNHTGVMVSVEMLRDMPGNLSRLKGKSTADKLLGAFESFAAPVSDWGWGDSWGGNHQIRWLAPAADQKSTLPLRGSKKFATFDKDGWWDYEGFFHPFLDEEEIPPQRRAQKEKAIRVLRLLTVDEWQKLTQREQDELMIAAEGGPADHDAWFAGVKRVLRIGEAASHDKSALDHLTS